MKICRTYLVNCILIFLFAFVGMTACSSGGEGDTEITSQTLEETLGDTEITSQTLEEPPGVHSFTGLPLTASGWTDFETIVRDGYYDARVVFVSNTDGNDSTGKTYAISDLNFDEYGMFQPLASSVYAYQDPVTAYNQLREGYPDIMLLKRGDVWAVSNIKWEKSGRSSAERMILGAYGSVVDPRPIINKFITGYGVNQPDSVFSHTIVTGIEFVDSFTRITGGANFLVEDCAFLSYPDSGLNIQGVGITELSNVAIRRCIIAERHPVPGSGHVQGIFVLNIHGLLLEENVLDTNGWLPNVVGSEATIFNHNVYIQYNNTQVIFRGNISARASSHGVHHRPGGINENNLYLQNPLVQFGYSGEGAHLYGPFSGAFRNNVVLDSRDIYLSPRGFGVRLEALRDAVIHDNIIGHQRTGTGNIEGISFGHFDDWLQHAERVAINNNIVYKWERDGAGTAISIQLPTFASILDFVIENNDFQQLTGMVAVLPTDSASLAEITIADNRHYSGAVAPFTPGGDFTGWVAATGETGGSFSEIGFLYPERDIESYMVSIGVTLPGYEEALDGFMLEARKQRRGNWREAYTAYSVINYIRVGFGLESVATIY